MNLKSIIVWVVIVLVLYLVWLWAYGDSWNHRLVGLHDATTMKVVPGHRLPGGATSDYTFSVWIYVTNWNVRIGEPKDVPFVIRETARKFQHTLSQVSVWERT